MFVKHGCLVSHIFYGLWKVFGLIVLTIWVKVSLKWYLILFFGSSCFTFMLRLWVHALLLTCRLWNASMNCLLKQNIKKQLSLLLNHLKESFVHQTLLPNFRFLDFLILVILVFPIADTFGFLRNHLVNMFSC